MQGKNTLLYFTFIILLMTSCATQVNLSKDQKILSKNKITIKSTKGVNVDLLKTKSELFTLLKQKPNRRWLFIVQRKNVFSYLDKRKNKKVLFRKTLEKIAEPPSILDEGLVLTTKLNMFNFLYNKGYFNVQVDTKIKAPNKKAIVEYQVNLNKLFTIDSITYTIDDPNIQKILDKNAKDSYLKPGKPVDNLLFQTEKSRITDLLTSSGYAEFNTLYIQNLDLDTSNRKTIVKLEISNPDSKTKHKRYLVSGINIYTDYNPNIEQDINITKLDSINFHSAKSNYYIKNSILSKKILFKPGDVYNKRKLDSTYFQLSKLEYFRFINMETVVDSSSSNQLIHNIYLTPNNKWVFDIGADLNYTSLKSNAVTSLFGTSGFVLLKNRNVFHRAEVFDTRLEAGAEISFFTKSLFNAININFNNTYTLPVFHDITATYRISNFITRPLGVKLKLPDSRTSFNLGLELVSLNNLFRYLSINSGISYNIPIDKNSRLIANTLELSYYTPTIYPGFLPILKDNSFLANSFTDKRLFTSFFLSHLQYFYQSRKKTNWTKTFIASLETSGLEISALDGITNILFKSKLSSQSKIELSKFVKIELDHRWTRVFENKNSIVFRVNYGLISPIGNSKAIPYIKEFFIGGPQSLRAWRLRELGPGADTLTSSVKENGNYYSAGDIKFETNVEFRFKIYWRFEGALFTDIGNIWLLPRTNNDNKLGNISTDFYKQLAAGSGLGLRLDFSYFLLRLDYGIKWRNPYQDKEGNYGIYTSNRLTYSRIIDNSTVHLALNYPF